MRKYINLIHFATHFSVCFSDMLRPHWHAVNKRELMFLLLVHLQLFVQISEA